jgi:hypothetical protein
MGEEYVADCLRAVGFDVLNLGRTTPDIDLIAQRGDSGILKIKVRTWTKADSDRRIASPEQITAVDAFVFVRADDLENLKAYVYQSTDLVSATRIAETPPEYPFTRDPGTKNPDNVAVYARKNWVFCKPEKLNAWDSISKISISKIIV